MVSKLRNATIIAVVVAILGPAEAVRGDEDERGGFELGLSTQAPGATTGLAFRLRYKNPDEPEGKPPALTAAEFELPAGLVIDDSAVPRCDATDAEFRAGGRSACSGDTRVGGGTLVAMTGVPGADPVTADIVAFNGDGQIIEVVFFQGTNTVAGIDRLIIEDGKLVAHPPTTPGGPPDGRTTIREINLDLAPRDGYITAPPSCPNGGWVSRARYEFADGGKTSLTSESPCTKPDLAVTVNPPRVRAGTVRTFRIEVRSPDPSCTQNARVRAGGRSTRTGPEGRSRMKLSFARAGIRRVVVTKPGCRPASAEIRVRPARD